MAATDIEINDAPERSRFEAYDSSGALLGHAEYIRESGVLVLTHTETDPAQQGTGVASALARGALDQVRAESGHVEPRCRFMASWIAKHPSYQDLVARKR